MKDKTLHEKLVEIQQSLKAPKNQRNSFGNYNYRSCEDILEAVKPLLNDIHLIIRDEIVHFPSASVPTVVNVIDSKGSPATEIVGGDRFYVKATAIVSDGENVIEAYAYAREAESKKGMDEAQVTGAASSYARKYALNGLFAIDDTKDADTQDNTEVKKSVESQSSAPKQASQFDEGFTREPVVNQDTCEHTEFWENTAKTEKNMGRKFKTCKSCKKFLGWLDTKELVRPANLPPKEEEPLPEEEPDWLKG